MALQIQREKAKSLTMEDYDLVDISEDNDNEKLTLKVSATHYLIGLLPNCGQFPYDYEV